jgi:hypothetical protein
MVNNHLVLLDLNRNDHFYIDYIDHLQHYICKYNVHHVPAVYQVDYNLFKNQYRNLIILKLNKYLRNPDGGATAIG